MAAFAKILTLGRASIAAVPEAGPVERAELERAYRVDRDRSLVRRLDLTIVLFVLLFGLSMYAESLGHPERTWAVIHLCVASFLASGFAALASHRLPDRLSPAATGALYMASISALVSVYEVVVGSLAETVAAGHLCHLMALAVLLPWGWKAQLAVASTALIGFALALPHASNPGGGWSPLTTLLTGVTASVVGAFFLDRYRRAAFLRAALLKREADISRALVRVAEQLNAHLNAPDMLEQVNRLAVAEMGCDWSVTYGWDDERQAFRLHAAEGAPPDVRLEFEQIDLAWDSIPLFAALEPGRPIEIEDVERQDLVPVALLRRAHISSLLYVPIESGGRIVALHSHGYYTRTGAFSQRQRRIALGIAHATALAVANAALIADLRAANRLKSEFVSTMSHELRTPLNVITGYADLLGEGAFDPVTERQRETIERIRTSALDLLELVNATLDLSRLEAGRDPVARVPIEIAPIFAELGRELEAMVQPDVTLAWHAALDGAEVWSDRAKLKTILKNLVGNALKFTASGRVEVRATADGGCLRIAVRDTGIGIAPADLPVVFEMFRQGDGSDSRRFGGVGLGLHIVHRLVDQLGGQVTVASVLGTGSTFTVVLPEALRARAGSMADLPPAPVAAYGG